MADSVQLAHASTHPPVYSFHIVTHLTLHLFPHTLPPICPAHRTTAAGLHPTAVLNAVPARQQAHVWVVGGVLAGVVYLHCHAMHRPLLALTADVLLVLTTAAALLALLSRALNLPPLLHTARPWQVSEGAAEAVVAAGANVLGAAEGVLRVAASGSDVRLFVKVLLFLYITAAVGRIASLATIIFFCVISSFTVSLLRSLASSVAGLVNARTTM
ncbi:unnamed protein product [Closterium sp. Naga37s-1]|nr:unnamed protein product [Closterium sp. Naga37s-1]